MAEGRLYDKPCFRAVEFLGGRMGLRPSRTLLPFYSSYHDILKLARTIADLAGSEEL